MPLRFYSELFHIYQLQRLKAILIKCVCTTNLSIEIAVKSFYIYQLQHHEISVNCVYVYQIHPSYDIIAYNHHTVQ